MSAFFTEADYEKSVIELFQNLGYSYIYAPELERDYSCPVLESTLQDCATLMRAVFCSATRPS